MFEIPLVSYITVTNRPTFVFAALNMFHAQSWPNKELVLLDSSPGAAGIDLALSFGEWMEPSPLMRKDYEGNPSVGVRLEYAEVKPGALIAAKRNLGLRLAHGDYMTWLDDDGWHDPFRVERLMALMNENEVDLIGLQGLYWHNPIERGALCLYRGQMGMPISGSMVWHRRCAEKHAFDTGHTRASDHFWINKIRADKALPHGTVNMPGLCVGISHGHNISNPKTPTLARPCGNKRIEDFYGNEPYGLSAHCDRIREAVKEIGK